MKKFQYNFIVAAVYAAPLVNTYVGMTLAVAFTIFGIINANKDE